ncbi:acyl carrier protein [Streptomyces sp. CB03238]|uniref:acyl carrier protein n=1 Tax=Streptomyces sp. CB03238 TaxID=1907777 RepID=UPI0015C46425|nr:acyl carrier protein [Streptomyces sp. CB03238]
MPTQATRDLVEEFVVETLVDCGAERDLINLSATFENLEIDSLDMVDLGQSANKEFQIRLRPKDFDGVKTVGEAVDVICATAGLQ